MLTPRPAAAGLGGAVCHVQGEHAHRIWSAIYNQSCFTDGLTCTEERVFVRLLSGMHTSISLHLVDQWLLDEAAGHWGPNMEEFERRLGRPEHKERVENLYFAYLFVLRAVLKAAPLLSAYDYTTGMEAEDAATRHLMRQLVGAGWHVCPGRLPQGLPAWCEPGRASAAPSAVMTRSVLGSLHHRACCHSDQQQPWVDCPEPSNQPWLALCLALLRACRPAVCLCICLWPPLDHMLCRTSLPLATVSCLRIGSPQADWWG